MTLVTVIVAMAGCRNDLDKLRAQRGMGQFIQYKSSSLRRPIDVVLVGVNWEVDVDFVPQAVRADTAQSFKGIKGQ